MKLAFVDYENVMSLKKVKLAHYDRLIIFCGKDQNSLSFGEMPAGPGSHLRIVKVPDHGKNNLDFHLAFELGRHHETEPAGVEFHVLTNDKDLEKLLKHLRLLGRKCHRIGLAIGPEEAKKAGQVAAPKEPAQHSPGLTRVISELSALPPQHRPKKRSSLINWISSRIGKTEKPDQVFSHLMENQQVQATGESIVYTLKNEPVPQNKELVPFEEAVPQNDEPVPFLQLEFGAPFPFEEAPDEETIPF